MASAEAEARGRGCRGAYVDTFSFQAAPFYQRIGFTLFGRLDDCPPGHDRLYFRKRFGTPAVQAAASAWTPRSLSPCGSAGPAAAGPRARERHGNVTPMIEGAIVVGDLLRPDVNGRPGGADRQTLWLWNAIKRQVHLACGLPVERLTTNDPPALVRLDRDVASARDRRRLLGVGLSRCASPTRSSDRLVIERLRRRFCVGYELPPWLVRLLDAHAVPYVDLRLHPIRFMDDLLFAARASCPDTQADLLAMAVPESEVLATAGLREAMCRYISEARVPDDTLLVVGQRRFDSTQIVGGDFFDAHRLTGEIHALCADHAAVVLKPHPLDRQHSLLEVAAAAPTRVIGVINDNTYRMMALPQVSAILTVNSGVAYEAPYFGKRVHTLAPLHDAPRVAGRGARSGGGARVARRRGADAGFLAHGAGAAHAGYAAGRHAPAAEAEPVAHRARQFLEFPGDRHRPDTTTGRRLRHPRLPNVPILTLRPRPRVSPQANSPQRHEGTKFIEPLCLGAFVVNLLAD